MVKSTKCYFLKKKECTDKFSNAKRSERPQKTTTVADSEFFPGLRKTASQHLDKSKTPSRRKAYRCHSQEHALQIHNTVDTSGYTQEKTRLVIARKHLKEESTVVV